MIFSGPKILSHIFRWTTEITGSSTQYGLIPKDHWIQPKWINEDRAAMARERMAGANVIYGGMGFSCGYFPSLT